MKTSEKCEDGKMTFSLVSSTVHRKNGVKHKYTKEEVDYFALYNVESDTLLLVPIELLLGRTTVTFNLEYKESRNQFKALDWKDFEFENIVMN